MKVTFGQQTTKVKQLADLLSQEISMGKYRSDCTLPSINKLSRDYQVSRDTVFKAFIDLTYIIHSGFISGYQNRYGDNLKPPTNVYHRMTA